MLMNWCERSIDDTVVELGSSSQGLNSSEAQKRLVENGPNAIKSSRKKSKAAIFVSQFLNVMIVVLVVAAAVSMIIGEYADTIVILIIVLLNAFIGFFQEYRAEKAIEALKKLASPVSIVLREGVKQKINAAELVVGDVVLLEAGTKVPADMRLIECYSLKLDESSLTGESVAVDKVSIALKKPNIQLSDCINMAFKGTSVTYGRGKGIVTATGMQTELGKIAEMLEEEEAATPLQVRLKEFSKNLTVIIIGIAVLLFIVGYLRGNSMVQMLLLALSLAVAAIPEALPAIITIALARGAKILVKQNALIRKLYAVETLGAVTFICSDKTGTLTKNQMTVSEIWIPGGEEYQSNFLKAMHLNHDVDQRDGNFLGDPTEIALVLFVQAHPAFNNSWGEKHLRINEIPFDSERKVMTTIHTSDDRYLIITKGAVESIIGICNHIPDWELVSSRVEDMAGRGLRVIAYAYAETSLLPDEINPETIEKEMKFLGIAGLIDPPREEVKSSIEQCNSAGIISVMITGDHPATAAGIARELKIVKSDADRITTGTELEHLSEEEFENIIEHIKVYSRVSPAQKLRIVKMLQKKGHFVSMTGDGVNDAPAIKKANIGVAMGITGTDVTKEAAHMILLDDNFATIVRAVKQGRRIYDNVRKFIAYIMGGNTAEVVCVLTAPLLGFPLPLLPVQILWINLVTDGLPALALAVEPVEGDVMKKPPRKSDESIFSGGTGRKILLAGFFMGLLTVAVEYYLLKNDVENWQTMVFAVLCFSQLWYVLGIHSNRSFFKRDFFRNSYLFITVILTTVLQLFIIYLPVFNTFFHTNPLGLNQLLAALVISSLIFWIIEARKIISGHLKV